MTSPIQNNLTQRQEEALFKIKTSINKLFNIDSFILFGSIVKGEADSESDIDLLIITKSKISRTERHKITNVVFEVNLQFDTNFSSVVVDYNTWNKGPYSVIPFHEEILQFGIKV